MEKINNFRSNTIWTNKNSSWRLNDSIIDHQNDAGIDTFALEIKEECVFNSTSKRVEQTKTTNYITLGRGWVDN